MESRRAKTLNYHGFLHDGTVWGKVRPAHGILGNRRLQEGDLLLFDLGVVPEGCCSDITLPSHTARSENSSGKSVNM
ncbi:M24 family metallopeptidase [Polycladomyces sp. WAk]|uniref:M24 family metallopeptidase n=1 Tax=Polycladomyces zharkentensis TaxID=2807616 RepID=A0ABS2WGB0_9BACL|nr:M24 family metallopeptidase [Polycladomyces sp. WAk]MBN2908590.1 M24 family metallopeptidase [Polycladomyces sp. WAk]